MWGEMPINLNKTVWLEFFHAYHDLPELWEVGTSIYKDRNRRAIALEKLLIVYKKLNPNASITALRRRIALIRYCYRREYVKVVKSKKESTTSDEVHVPNLWYYDELYFLGDQYNQQSANYAISKAPDVDNKSKKNTKRVRVHESETESDSDPTPEMEDQEKPATNEQPQRRRSVRIRNFTRKSLPSPQSVNREDEAAIFAASWATSFRKLAGVQRIFAKKAIEEILALGQLEVLTFASVNTRGVQNSLTPTWHDYHDSEI